MLVEKFEPQQIICFASTVITEEREGSFINKDQDCQYNCSLLLVADNAGEIHYAVQDFSNFHYKIGRITIICHEQAVIDEALKTNSRFFMSIYKKFWLLYRRDLFKSVPINAVYNPNLAAEKATKHMDHRLSIAEGFLAGAYECFINQQYLVSTFMLHQVVEQCCILLIRVNMGYRSEFHNLHRLLGLCDSFSKKPYEVFFSSSKEDERVFQILMKSYSKSRYSSDFQIEEKDALLLYERAVAFLSLTKDMCKTEIATLKQQAEIYKLLSDAG